MTDSTGFRLGPRGGEWAAVMAAFAVAGWGLWTIAPMVDLMDAVQGFSPREFVFKQLHRQAMAGDYPSGVETYSVSSIMQLVLAARAYFGLDPTLARSILIGVEMFLTTAVVVLLTREVLPRAGGVVLLAAVLVLAASNFRDADLSRWGGPNYYGLFYNLADVLRVLAILAVFRGRVLLGGVLIGLGFTVHPTLAVMAGLFAAGAVGATWSEYRLKRLLGGGAAAAAIGSLWFAAVIDFSSANSTVPPGAWVELTKFANFHFYPLELGLFWSRHFERLYPFMAFLMLLFYYFPRVVGLQHRRRLVGGLLAAAAMMLAGFGLSESGYPTVIKLALHRANDLALLFGAPVVAAGLVGDVRDGRPWRAAIGGFALASPFETPYGIPILAAGLLVLPAAFGALRQPRAAPVGDLASLVLCGLAIGSLLVYATAGVAEDWRHPSYTAYFPWLAGPYSYSLPLALLLAVAVLPRRLQWRGRAVDGTLVIALCALAAIWHYEQRPFRDAQALAAAEAYKDVQVWARNETPADSLFIPVPNHYYGWRAFSHRASFGNLREWVMTGWLYSSDLQAYREGMQRVHDLGMSLKPYLERTRPASGFFEMHRDLGSYYHGLSAARFEALATAYDVDYAVFEKAQLDHASPLPVAYENDVYLVGRIPPPGR